VAHAARRSLAVPDRQAGEARGIPERRAESA
jgi:hypothetical protein